jgi:hypothetical protein
LTFVLPAIVVTYLLTLLASEYIDDLYHFTFSRILFTLVGLVVALFLCAWVFNAFGMNVTFLTAQLPSIHDNTQLVDPREIASKFYSFQLPYALAMIVIFYSTAGTLFKENNMFSSGTRERLIVNLKKVARRRSRQKKK